MKIGIDIRSLQEKKYSGVSEYTLNLLHSLFALDKENSYILFCNAYKQRTLPKFDYANVKIKRFNYSNRLFNLSLKYLKYPKIDKLIGDLDIFFMPNLQFASFSDLVKIVVTVHDLSFVRYPDFFYLKQRLWHKLINPKKLCQIAKQVIAVSENTKKDIVDLYQIEENKITTIYSGISKKYHQVQSKDKLNKIQEKYNLPNKFILYLGNVEKRKNIESLITAFSKINDNKLYLVIAGKGSNSSKNERIKYIGYVDAKDKAAIYTLAKFFVYPSYYEGFGFPPLEAMACGTPVICSYSSSLPEIVGSAALMIDPFNSTDLQKAMENLLSNNILYQKMKLRGEQQVKKFKWEDSAKNLLRIFQNL